MMGQKRVGKQLARLKRQRPVMGQNSAGEWEVALAVGDGAEEG